MAATKSKKKRVAKPKTATKPSSRKKAAKQKAKGRAKPSSKGRKERQAKVARSKPAKSTSAATTKKKTSKSRKKPATRAKAAPKKSTKQRSASSASHKIPVVPKSPLVAPKMTQAPRRVSKAKMLSRTFLLELAEAVRDAVRPAIDAGRGREIVGTAASGDATFELDKLAEKALLTFLKNAKQPVAYYSEDSGYTTFTSGQPTNLLIVDPIDGTRAAKSGFEGCVVSVCSTRVIERPTIADLDNGLVLEIMGDKYFYAEKGTGARMYVGGNNRKIKLTDNANLETVSWSMTVPARPAELIFPTAARLIDLSSVKGGFFACNSTSYSLTRLVTNQLDACVDFANRFYRDIPSIVEDSFINAGRGIVLGICPYDFAAALLIAQEAGCVVSDAYGNDFDDVLLLDSSVSNQRSIIAAANGELHEKLISFFDTRIKQFEGLLKARA